MKEKIVDYFLLILSSPLILFWLCVHLKECVLKNVDYYRDKFYMKRMNLIDDAHVNDYMKWNNGYHARRAIDENFRYASELTEGE
jgi:hypothetical protein